VHGGTQPSLPFREEEVAWTKCPSPNIGLWEISFFFNNIDAMVLRERCIVFARRLPMLSLMRMLSALVQLGFPVWIGR
jgi:hypothetical protein